MFWDLGWRQNRYLSTIPEILMLFDLMMSSTQMMQCWKQEIYSSSTKEKNSFSWQTSFQRPSGRLQRDNLIFYACVPVSHDHDLYHFFEREIMPASWAWRHKHWWLRSYFQNWPCWSIGLFTIRAGPTISNMIAIVCFSETPLWYNQ